MIRYVSNRLSDSALCILWSHQALLWWPGGLVGRTCQSAAMAEKGKLANASRQTHLPRWSSVDLSELANGVDLRTAMVNSYISYIEIHKGHRRYLTISDMVTARSHRKLNMLSFQLGVAGTVVLASGCFLCFKSQTQVTIPSASQAACYIPSNSKRLTQIHNVFQYRLRAAQGALSNRNIQNLTLENANTISDSGMSVAVCGADYISS